MSPKANHLCDDPFRACLNWIIPNSPSRPASPQDTQADSPKRSSNISQEPVSAIPMNFIRRPSDAQSMSDSTTGQSEAWRSFGAALQALETGIGIFPPLKAAVSELLACTTRIQIAGQNQREYDQLALELAELMRTLQSHLPDSKPRWMPYSIENVARFIGQQAAYIKLQQDRSGLRHAIRASEDEVNIAVCYRRIGHIFRQLQTDISLSVWDLEHEQWVNTQLKDLGPVHDARHNAALSIEMQRHGCTPNTRVKILKDAFDWSQSPEAATIYWMSGMAGTGKTTIAYSLCQQLEESKQLGACFFCSRVSPDCRNELCNVLANNADVSKREVSIQFEKLIVSPLLKVKDAIPADLIVVIDALDECSDSRSTQTILELLSGRAATLPVKIFVTSRPEPAISNTLLSRNTYRLVFRLHEVEESLVQADIQTYLEHELSSLSINPDDIDKLTLQAGCLFIFAATAVRYIEPHDTTVDHGERLRTILNAHSKTRGEAYQELDELYMAILSQVLCGAKGGEGKLRHLVLRTVICAREPLDIPALMELTDSESEEVVQRALLPLQSVLRVSTDMRVISTLHASFPDFILNAERSKEFHCNPNEHEGYMASQCFGIIKKSLRFNICELETSSQLDQDVPDLESRVSKSISSGLSYACRYWGDHLYGANHPNNLVDIFDEFLRRGLLYWMEVLNLKGWIGSATTILLQALRSLPADDGLSELRSIIQDSRNFITAYAASPASHSTPHIYVSALPLASTQSFIRKAYWPLMKGPVCLEGPGTDYRGDVALATWAVGSWVSKLALSRDGGRITSGDGDGSIAVWDVSNGRNLLRPLKKHQAVVYAIVFSPDDTRIASGSYDCKICIWNAYSGDTLPGSFEGHTGPITGLAFSPGGEHLVSCSEDCTIRTWDSFTGVQIGLALTGHTEAVMSIALTSSGEHLVSGSDDHTIRIWDLRTSQTVVGPLEGHTDWIDCVALSPDDRYIASSSRDCTVRIWSVEDGTLALNPLLGHTDRVWCVAYSFDGKKIASGGYDQTIRVWSSETGELIAGPFRQDGTVYSILFSMDSTQIISGCKDGTVGIWDASRVTTTTNTVLGSHTDSIQSVSLSVDGARLVSGSNDNTICVWGTSDGALILGPLIGHTDLVWSVAFAPNGTSLVSSSMDRTIRTWDAHTGSPLTGPLLGHAHGVTAVAVSPDSRIVASGSLDRSIKIWDLQTGAEIAEPPIHHASRVLSIDFSPDGSCIASASKDMSVCLWDAESGALVRKLEQHTSFVTCVRFSPDSRKLVSCSQDRTILVWDIEMGVVSPGPLEGIDREFWAVSFSPNGAKIASGAEDGTICLWDAAKGTILESLLHGHRSWVYYVAFTPDNKRIVSGSWDGTIRFCDLDNAGRIQHQDIHSQIADDGWVRDSESQRVLWLPSDLRRLIPTPPCSLAISSRGSVHMDLNNMIYGNHWVGCYSAPSDYGVHHI